MTLLLLLMVLFSLTLALVPAVWFHANLREYLPPALVRPGAERPAVSVLIPARNEQDGIGLAVSAALGSDGVALEVIVLDDHSDDATAEIVSRQAAADPRVRLVSAPELPEGWCGKQHACWVLAREARNNVLIFLDADVRLAPDALARMAAFLHATGADLASGIPHQETVGLLEKMVIPLIHFILLGFLPIRVMRRTTQPQFAAGCGQLFITTRDAYERSGGHAAIRTTLHDGIKLPRAYRIAGLRTDLFDATELAECRMYRSAGALWSGLAKNAGEALGSPRLIVPMTLLLLGGQVMPVVLLAPGNRIGACRVAGVGNRAGGGGGRDGVLSAAGGGQAIPSVTDGRFIASGGRVVAGGDSVVCAVSKWAGEACPLERAGVSGTNSSAFGPGGATNPVKKSPMRTITLDDRSINLTQVLKLGGCVQSGGEAKMLIAGGQVKVNGQVELRKRCQMKAGDKVAIEGGPTIVLLAGAPTEVAAPDDTLDDAGH